MKNKFGINTEEIHKVVKLLEMNHKCIVAMQDNIEYCIRYGIPEKECNKQNGLLTETIETHNEEISAILNGIKEVAQ